MKVNIQLREKGAKIPQKAHPEDFGYDCYVTSEEQIAPNLWKYGLGFSLELIRDTYTPQNVCFDLRARSSCYKHGMILTNGVGTIDELYRGEVCAVFYHFDTTKERYEVGDKICQIALHLAPSIDFKEVSALSATERGEGGFGSSGN